MRFAVVPDQCVEQANNTAPTYPPVVGTYNQTNCNFVNLTDTDYGVNATVLSCQNAQTSLTIVSQSGSIIGIQITYYPSSGSMKEASAPTTIDIDATITALGDVYFAIPLEGTSYAQCTGHYADSIIDLSCKSFYSPSSGGTVALADTTSSFQCESGSCKSQTGGDEDEDKNNGWWISLLVIGSVGIVVVVVAIIAGAVYYKKHHVEAIYEPIEH